MSPPVVVVVAVVVVVVVVVVFCICGLPRFWSLEKYVAIASRGGSVREEPADGDTADTKRLHLVDRVIHSSMFWAMLQTLDSLFSVIRSCFAWCEGCACHTDILSKDAE